MNRLWKILQWACDALRFGGLACLVGMMLLTCVDVIGRKFGHPVFGSVELVGFMATLAVAFALPYTHQVRAHIGVEVLVQVGYFATWLSGMTEALWDDGAGVYFSENEVLHLGMLLWLAYVVVALGPTLHDAPDPESAEPREPAHSPALPDLGPEGRPGSAGSAGR